jgi:hypothetical protein
MKRLAIAMLVIVIILVGITLLLNVCDKGTGEPAADKALYKVIADNRVYFTNNYTKGTDRYGEYIILDGYWHLIKSEWLYDRQSFYMSYKGYKNIQIIKR